MTAALLTLGYLAVTFAFNYRWRLAAQRDPSSMPGGGHIAIAGITALWPVLVVLAAIALVIELVLVVVQRPEER